MQSNTIPGTARQDKTRQYKITHSKTGRHNLRQSETIEYNTIQYNTTQSNLGQENDKTIQYEQYKTI